MRKGRPAIGIAVASTAVVGALGIGLPLVSVAEPRVSITEFAVTPESVTVVAGCAVTWSNDGTTAHRGRRRELRQPPAGLRNQSANLIAQAGTYAYRR